VSTGPPVYYFGVWDQPGHYLHQPSGRLVGSDEERRAVYFNGGNRHIDGTLAPRRLRGFITWGALHERGLPPQGEEFPDGEFLRHVLDNGFTAIQWWDRQQGDKRRGCCSTVLALGEYSSDEMLAMFAKLFPSRKARLDATGVKLVEVKPES